MRALVICFVITCAWAVASNAGTKFLFPRSKMFPRMFSACSAFALFRVNLGTHFQRLARILLPLSPLQFLCDTKLFQGNLRS